MPYLPAPDVEIAARRLSQDCLPFEEALSPGRGAAAPARLAQDVLDFEGAS